MHRRLIIIRHAQTADKQAGQRDYDRILTQEGTLQSRKTGQQLVLNKSTPEFILCSSAVRAVNTARLLAETSGVSPSLIRPEDELYEADAGTWTQFIRQLPPRVTTAACVGHNPALSLLASRLSQRKLDLAPAAFVIYRVNEGSWKEFDSVIEELSTQATS